MSVWLEANWKRVSGETVPKQTLVVIKAPNWEGRLPSRPLTRDTDLRRLDSPSSQSGTAFSFPNSSLGTPPLLKLRFSRLNISDCTRMLKRLFRRDAETSTRDACVTHSICSSLLILLRIGPGHGTNRK